ncbi:UDP-xylose and UDP-N-acetylglucosamine transporter isoform X1 [Pteropus alecto]|uniref:UDP-xylose and UDP-N-acetylglucosamine transporter isoform X1 n=1 Tax=Pteropus alecto TaxID=9402 RepID=UPI000D53B583|nr:UDP-xylose and UDP-N-acetylglucosamine transporter isoform X1 [Pteropus alecto]
MRPFFAVGLVFAGCCSNVIFLELLARKHPGCGNIVTFAQFLFIAVEGFLFEADLGRKQPAIPIRYYAVMVTMFFTVSVVNNYALNLNIAMPLHMIFRSGSLIANMVLGIIILKKRYSIFKYTSIALVSVGIFICTFMSAKQVTSQSSLSENDGFQAFAWWLLGIGALTFALLMSARMGIFQETLYKQFGKHSKEALFYNHALPLPGFIFLASDIYDHAVLFNKSELYQVPVVGVAVPIMWFYLLMNIITQPRTRPEGSPVADLSVSAENRLNPSPPEPVHSVALAGHLVCLHWDPHVHRGVEQLGSHKKPASEGGQEELRPVSYEPRSGRVTFVDAE